MGKVVVEQLNHGVGHPDGLINAGVLIGVGPVVGSGQNLKLVAVGQGIFKMVEVDGEQLNGVAGGAQV